MKKKMATVLVAGLVTSAVATAPHAVADDATTTQKAEVNILDGSVKGSSGTKGSSDVKGSNDAKSSEDNTGSVQGSLGSTGKKADTAQGQVGSTIDGSLGKATGKATGTAVTGDGGAGGQATVGSAVGSLGKDGVAGKGGDEKGTAGSDITGSLSTLGSSEKKAEGAGDDNGGANPDDQAPVGSAANLLSKFMAGALKALQGSDAKYGTDLVGSAVNTVVKLNSKGVDVLGSIENSTKASDSVTGSLGKGDGKATAGSDITGSLGKGTAVVNILGSLGKGEGKGDGKGTAGSDITGSLGKGEGKGDGKGTAGSDITGSLGKKTEASKPSETAPADPKPVDPKPVDPKPEKERTFIDVLLEIVGKITDVLDGKGFAGADITGSLTGDKDSKDKGGDKDVPGSGKIQGSVPSGLTTLVGSKDNSSLLGSLDGKGTTTGSLPSSISQIILGFLGVAGIAGAISWWWSCTHR
ncbi:hypothetical protein [Corynebacterium bovis]|uniref:hypothetical protein n=1 Tax=Corynebacterium bovis TaxID=36808 RepID=UPI000F653DF6|nr:hypothetical protein [Corynebacterium bovis]MDN8578475.1 hypothetical protein [Corynebacterium bovis]